MSWPGTINITVISATAVPSADLNGKSDPFVKVTCGKIVNKTKVIEKTLTPQWNESKLLFIF